MDVSIVDHVILEKILGMQSDDEKRIAYTHNREEAVSRALNENAVGDYYQYVKGHN
jgi:uncharacterized protein (DUF1015 family)